MIDQSELSIPENILYFKRSVKVEQFSRKINL